MGRLPAGLVTFVFTDIEGSTALFGRLGDSYHAILKDHSGLLREAFVRHGGVEVRTEGDAFFVAFSTARGAVAACVDRHDERRVRDGEGTVHTVADSAADGVLR